jgi:hypothetical protein
MEIKALRNKVHLVGFRSIDEVELALEKCGYQEDVFAFVVTEIGSPPTSDRISSTVQVTHKANGKTRTYNSGDRTAWAVEFESDLKSGFYN